MLNLLKHLNKNSILLFCVILLFWNNVFFCLIDDRGLNNQEVLYLSKTIKLSPNKLFESNNFLEGISFVMSSPSEYPFILPLMYLALRDIFGLNHKLYLIINQIFLLLLLYSVYKIGKNIHNQFTGILAMFITLTIPEIISFSRQITFTFPPICIIAFTMSFIIKKVEDITAKDLILFGILLGVSSLMKQEFFSFFIGPVIILLYSLRKDNRLKFLILGLTTAFSLAMLWWWSFGLSNILQTLGALPSIHIFSSSQYNPSLIQIIEYISKHLFLISLGPFYFILFLGSYAYLLRLKKTRYIFLLLLSYILIPLLIWVRIPVDLYPFYPSLPAVAIFCAYAISNITQKNRLLLTTVLILIVLNGFSIAHFKILSTSEEISYYAQAHNYRIENKPLDNFQCLLSAKCPKPSWMFPRFVAFNPHDYTEDKGILNMLKCILSTQCHPHKINYKSTNIGTEVYKINYFVAVKPKLIPINEIFNKIKEEGQDKDIIIVSDQSNTYYGCSIFDFYKTINQEFLTLKILCLDKTMENPQAIAYSELSDNNDCNCYLVFHKSFNSDINHEMKNLIKDKNLTKVWEFKHNGEFLVYVYGNN